MSQAPGSPRPTSGPGATVVRRGDLRVGPLLAEGGEGRVHELADTTATLVKLYRSPVPAGEVEALVGWPLGVATFDPALAARVAASAAWPVAVVADDADPSRAAGILLARAPRRFSVRHRDGRVRLASLSYLTAPPGQRVAAYGLALPSRFSPERIGVVYALARLLEAFQAATPSISHGDLSAKNVLWSLERGPEVFVLDCDSAARHGALDTGPDDRRRAMTPNWDDPAVAPGANPTPDSDRYSLALTFLRVTGAAHFPIQQRQRSGDPLHVDIAVPPAAAVRSLAGDAPVWDLCERSLSRDRPAQRPAAGEWVAALEQILDDLGAMRTVRAVWAAQGGGAPGRTPTSPPDRAARHGRDVTVVPVAGDSREPAWRRIVPIPRGPGLRGAPGAPAPRPAPRAPRVPVAATVAATPAGGYRRAGSPSGGPGPQPAPSPPPVPVRVAARAGAARAAAAWLRLHRRMVRALATRGERATGVARLAGCLVVDVAALSVALFGAAMLFAPLQSI